CERSARITAARRQIGPKRGKLRAGQRLDSLKRLIVESRQLIALCVLRPGKRKLHRQYILRVESRIDILKPHEAADEQASRYEQNQREGHLEHHKHASHEIAPPAFASRAPAFFERNVKIRLRRMKGRDQAEDYSCQQRYRKRETKH